MLAMAADDARWPVLREKLRIFAQNREIRRKCVSGLHFSECYISLLFAFRESILWHISRTFRKIRPPPPQSGGLQAGNLSYRALLRADARTGGSLSDFGSFSS